MSAEQPASEQASVLPLIRASELTQYSFCRRAWWLGTVKRVPANNQAARTRGIRSHRDHANQVQSASRWRQASIFLLGGGGVLLGVALFLYWLL